MRILAHPTLGVLSVCPPTPGTGALRAGLPGPAGGEGPALVPVGEGGGAPQGVRHAPRLPPAHLLAHLGAVHPGVAGEEGGWGAGGALLLAPGGAGSQGEQEEGEHHGAGSNRSRHVLGAH